MKRWIAIALVWSASVGGQITNKTVLPPGFDTQNGNTSETVFATPTELQQLFRASSVGTQWTGPVSITGIAFRVTDGAAAGFSTVIPRIEIRLSTSSRPPEQLTSDWEQNKGSDASVVFLHDNVSLSGTAGQPINPFDVRFVLDQPFTYDSNNGHLLMYIKTTLSPGGASNVDVHSFGGNEILSTSPVAMVRTLASVRARGLVTEFSAVAVPEPTSLGLLCFGGLAFLLRRKRVFS